MLLFSVILVCYMYISERLSACLRVNSKFPFCLFEMAPNDDITSSNMSDRIK